MNSEAVATAASTLSDEAFSNVPIPWYANLLRSPGLAFAMGALVLTFGGILGYLALQQQAGNESLQTASVKEQEPVSGGPSYSGETVNAASASAPDTAVSDTVIASNTTQRLNTANSAANKTESSELRKDLAGDQPATVSESRLQEDGIVAAKPPLAMSPGIAMSQPAKSMPDAKNVDEIGKLKSADKEIQVDGSSRDSDDQRNRNVIPPSRGTSGPIRSADQAPEKKKVERSLSAAEQTSTRTISGKSFDLRGGVWYDLSYKGQSTTKVRRGTDDFQKLDSGLRGIANSLDGVIIVVWKQKAYRIQ
jgi:hypothetical protein